MVACSGWLACSAQSGVGLSDAGGSDSTTGATTGTTTGGDGGTTTGTTGTTTGGDGGTTTATTTGADGGTTTGTTTGGDGGTTTGTTTGGDGGTTTATTTGKDGGTTTGTTTGGDGGTTTGTASVNVLTSHYNVARTGANTSETILTTSNVSKTTFGLKFSVPVTGRVYGQPLYVSGLTIAGAVHNVVYVATEHNMVYAFDADTGSTLWAVGPIEKPAILGTGGGASWEPGCADMGSGASYYEVGITSTPVIDLTKQLIYVVAKTPGKQMLHGLSLTTGMDGPTPEAVGPPGFSSDDHPLNRPGLLLLNGVIYVGFGSHCDAPVNGYHGYIMGQNQETFALTANFNTTPNGSDGAIWQSGVGLATDGTNIWFDVGNGTTDGTNGGDNMAMRVVEVTPSGTAPGSTLNIKSSYGGSSLAAGDNDLVAGAILVSNGGNDYVLAGGKSGYIILLNAANATGSGPNNGLTGVPGGGPEVHNIVTWNGGTAGQLVYTWPSNGPLNSHQLTGGALTNEQQNNIAESASHPGGILSVSSNGTTAGTGILWGLVPPPGADAWHGITSAILYAVNASDVAQGPLWDSTMNAGDAIGTYAKFSPPTVANGKVYAAAFPNSTAEAATGHLMVYGLK